ncbi:hypothetical protein [Variovorax sp. 54]|uniref:hypothetical protein n=1 Tax=Variovorax sp. 54 TaxID=2035212 RepID=UPI000C190C52|nr:hypothetical protein [Variovorax sp. 54]
MALLAEATAQGVPGRIVKKVSIQQGAVGQPLDDVIVEAEGQDSVGMRLSLQVKRSLRISDARTNSDFRETIIRAYATVVSNGFQATIDRVGAITDEIAEGARRDFETLCEWARMDPVPASLATKLNTEGVGGAKTGQYAAVKNILSGIAEISDLDAATHKLLAHFVLMRVDMLHEGSATQASAVASLANVLQPQDRARADDLWQRLLTLVRASEGGAGVFDRKTLVSRLNGSFRLSGSAVLQSTLAFIREESVRGVAEIGNQVDGFGVARAHLVAEATTAIGAHLFVQLTGMPGTGKSAVLRALVERAITQGTTLFLKADRLAGGTWTQYLAANGIAPSSIEDLLVEIEALGVPTLFVDGLDRIEIENRGILTDLLKVILQSPLLKGWKIVAALRDNGIEPLRTWLPPELLRKGAATLSVGEFSEEESEALANARPSLRPMLFGSPDVRAIVRRPFFAAVLSAGHTDGDSVPMSEIELASAWWERGGYSAEAAAAGRRRQALVQLARKGAFALGRKIPALDVDARALHELQIDGVVRPLRAGQTWRFAHDIFFEWAFLQLLISNGEDWLTTVQEAGEPPALGRVVELLSQSEIKDGDDWAKQLERLEEVSGARTQWLRAWMTGPLGLPQFTSVQATYEAAMLVDGGRRVSKLSVWFQAEKSKANPNFLDAAQFPQLSPEQRLRYADAMAWPSDVDTWRRLCNWLLTCVESLDPKYWGNVLTVFEVWQNLGRDFRNKVSKSIVDIVAKWTVQIDAGEEDWRRLRGEADLTKAPRPPSSLSERLRSLILIASPAYPEVAKAYMRHLLALEHLPQGAFEGILTFSPRLGASCPKELVDFIIVTTKNDLPKEEKRHEFYSGPDTQAWHDLGLDDHQAYLPPAPSREPFPSVFKAAPGEGRRLVRSLANRAIEAWQQLCEFDRQGPRKPLSLKLIFPWGEQEFWGDGQVYQWFRGAHGSYLADSALMALESWAFEHVDAGTSVDEVIALVLDGHHSVAALGIAVSIALEKNHVSATTLPLITSQRLWKWDIKRMVSENGFLLGAGSFNSADERHTQAAHETGKRRARKVELRWLASLAVLQGGEFAQQASKEIADFPHALPFDYVDETKNASLISSLRRTAEIWAEVGKAENYEAKTTDDGKGALISLNNPKAVGPDIDAINERQATMVLHMRVNQWAEKTLEAGVIDDEAEFINALNTARQLDAADLFSQGYDHISSEHSRQSLVAGVAAVILSLPTSIDVDTREWASNVCFRAWRTAEVGSNYTYRDSQLVFHPVLFATQGLAGILRADRSRHDALEALLQLFSHPYTQIEGVAMQGLIGLWDAAPDAAWLGLRLGISLSILERSQYMVVKKDRLQHEQDRINASVRWALDEIAELDAPPVALPAVPDAWDQVEPSGSDVAEEGGQPAKWRPAERDLDWRHLSRVIAAIPLEAVVNDEHRFRFVLDWLEGLERWTIDRFNPPSTRDRPGKRPRDEKPTELYQWRITLFSFLALVSARLEPTEALRRFVNPILSLDDETFVSFADPFASPLVANIVDAPDLPAKVLELLAALMPRVTSHSAWKRSSWRDEGMRNNELERILRSVFFIKWGDLPRTARFANGNWQELGQVLDLVAPLLRAHGSDATLAAIWATLCERAFEHYPIESFVEHLELVLHSTAAPTGWNSALVPPRVASLIQRFSERGVELPEPIARKLLRALDSLVDMGDRRAAAIQTSEVFRRVKLA